MIKAFVFGKFFPFHKGHKAMIAFALTQCDFLSVLVCKSDRENMPAELRKNWIEETFAHLANLEVKIFDYSEDDLPNTSVSSTAVSKIWAERFKEIYPDFDCLITSEKYGDYVASYMEIEHIAFDLTKENVPISASAIRADLWTNWNYLPACVKASFVSKVVLLGTESTGKTTLTERLKNHYDCTAVEEAGRTLIPDSKQVEWEDLVLVATEQTKNVERAATGSSPLIIIDTNLLITKSYAQFMFNRALKVDQEIENANKADLYLYLTKDAPYVQDGTRLNEAERNELDQSHRKILATAKIPFTEISGNWDERFEKSITLINALIQAKNKLD